MTAQLLFATLNTAFFTLIALPNNITIVKDNDPEPQANTAQMWCRVRMEIRNRSQVGMGRKRWRTTGAYVIDLARPTAKGIEEHLAVFDDVNASFRGLQLGFPMVSFRPPPSLTGGTQKQAVDGWAKMLISIPFVYDEVE